MSAKILIIDDEALFREDIAELLRAEGYECRTAPDGVAGVAEAQRFNPDVVLCDVVMPEMGGVEVLDYVVKSCPECFFILITAFGTLETAVEAFRKGASDYILKPVIIEDVMRKIERYHEHQKIKVELRQLRRLVHKDEAVKKLQGKSDCMIQLHEMIKSVSKTDSTVLLTGDSGTGKELVARAIHERGISSNQPFVAVNCAALPEQLFESELFGHIRGAFTGAQTDKEGYFRAAHGGTLFLDEVSEIPINLQAKLLRCIETKEIVPVGRTQGIPVNVRIISATNQNLLDQVDMRTFRPDLLYRLRVVEIRLPSLKERMEDIPILVDHFVNQYNQRLKRNFSGVDNGAMRYLMAYSWPGNVRELENVIERAMILGKDTFIGSGDLPSDVTGSTPLVDASDDLKQAVRLFEREHIRYILRSTGGNKEEAARRMKINPATLYRKIADLSIKEL